MRRLAPALLLAFVAVVLACGNNPRARLVVQFDGGADGASDAAPDADAGSSLPPDAGPYLGGPCVDDAQCNDSIPCTYDSCDKTLDRCRNVPDDTQCQDNLYCDGKEVCVPGHGCEPGAVVSCDNGNACQIARCVEATKSCAYVDRDADQDGDPDAHCLPGHDCDDLNPDVSSIHAEVCANGIDDNCNGVVDEMPCVLPKGSTCGGAVALPGPGTYPLSTVGANKTFATSCSVGSPAAGVNVVASVTVPPGGNVDLDVWASTQSTEVAVAIDGACGDATTELACASGGGATSVHARARNVAPGTYFIVVTTQLPSPAQVNVSFLAPSSAPTNIDCASATPIQPGTATAVSILGAPTSLPTACPSTDGELTYSFNLAQPEDVRVFATTVQGSGTPVVGLRAPPCTGATDELECAQGGGQPLFERALPAGTYVVTLGATSSIDASLQVVLSPPTPVPPDQTCASPPVITPNQPLAYDLSAHENAIKDGCFPSGPDAAYDLTLTAASDVLLIDRFPETEGGAVSLDDPTCASTGMLACDAEGPPARVAKRNVPAGDYRVVVADQLGQQGTVQALVRPTVAPTILAPGAAGTCAQAVDASKGGFFTGDTSTLQTGYGTGCDAPGQPPGSPPNQVLALDLAQPQRVVLDMEGSSYTTILDVLQGPACPGSPVAKACFVGFGQQKSFLDLELPAGQYWILVSGYAGSKGAWNLDVRVLSP